MPSGSHDEESSPKRIQLVATVHGRVQGVGFRYYARNQAARLGLTGWVSNQRDGTVRVVCEGPEFQVKKFHAWLKTGPPSAQVISVDARYRPAEGGFSSFTVEGWAVLPVLKRLSGASVVTS